VHVDRLDHLVLTVNDLERTIAFYVDVLERTIPSTSTCSA
jgi:catechol 2,3-dioxygenase-like lactoylglutathione lyase family enzyme